MLQWSLRRNGGWEPSLIRTFPRNVNHGSRYLVQHSGERTDRAARFYRDAFGWRINPLTKEDDTAFDYNVVLNSESDETFVSAEPGRINGCIVKKATGITTPVVLVEVEDLDRSAQRIVAAGGRVVSEKIPMRSLDGVFILATDPEGNMVEIFQPNA